MGNRARQAPLLHTAECPGIHDRWGGGFNGGDGSVSSVVTVEMQQRIKVIVQKPSVSHDAPFSKVETNVKLLIIQTSMLFMIDAKANAKPHSTSFNWRTEFLNDDSQIIRLGVAAPVQRKTYRHEKKG